MRRRALIAPAALVAVILAPCALTGCMETATYGTGEMPEVAMFRELSGGLMTKREKKPQIAYQPRAPLVMPPSGEQLPPPAESAESANPNWPVDPNAEVVADLPVGSSDTARAQAEYKRLKPLAGVMQQHEADPRGNANVMDNYYRNAIDSRKQRNQFRQAVADADGMGASSERRFLTDPPTEYRQPATTALPEYEQVKKKKKGPGFFSRLFGSS